MIQSNDPTLTMQFFVIVCRAASEMLQAKTVFVAHAGSYGFTTHMLDTKWYASFDIAQAHAHICDIVLPVCIIIDLEERRHAAV